MFMRLGVCVPVRLPMNTDTMLAWLRQLGLSTEIIEQVSSKLPASQALPFRKIERLVFYLPTKKKQLQGALQKLEKRLMDQMQGLQEITEQQSRELSKGTEEYEEALRTLEAENWTRQPPPAPHEEEAGQGVDDLPPLGENDEDMLEQSSKRQKNVPVFSSVLVLAGLPTLDA